MGEAKKRGSREQRIAKAIARKCVCQNKQSPSGVKKMGSQEEYERISRILLEGLTTPGEINEQVVQFARQLSNKSPLFLDCHPELWSRQSCCDMNVEKYIEKHGGSLVCGYRIWYNGPYYIEGERHAVWTDGKEYRDVSFSDDGEGTILFVPDDLGFEDVPGKVRHTFNAEYEWVVDLFNKFDLKIRRMSSQEAWDKMLTYERWLAGERMPNMWVE
ncbi:hypothetical protein [Fundidesulfovibrio agrisoli]|uniref:hypothetical protein n=1 Tax=Fundidesulfovibrio agrisoli TaxID=2922717 RepID=UPI001FAD0F3A|nr:hypothetical protein [Fundidesulfovibrio agrisoli]